MGRPVLVRSLQGHESHAVHRLRRSGSGGNDGRLAHHAQHDRGRHVLRHVHRPRHCPHTVPGLVPPTVSGEGKALNDGEWRLLSDLIHAVLHLSGLIINGYENVLYFLTLFIYIFFQFLSILLLLYIF